MISAERSDRSPDAEVLGACRRRADSPITNPPLCHVTHMFMYFASRGRCVRVARSCDALHSTIPRSPLRWDPSIISNAEANGHI